jgi:hypothetical protein
MQFANTLTVLTAQRKMGIVSSREQIVRARIEEYLLELVDEPEALQVH